MSEHREVRDLLEVAAVEPGGLDRLEAGDTPEAALVVGHLAGCPSCLEEMARLRRAETLLRPIVAEAPDPALRARTLASVHALGVAREPGAASEPGASREAAVVAGIPVGRSRRAISMPAWAASLAAVLVIGLIAGGLLAGGVPDGGRPDPAVALEAITGETASLLATDDVRTVALTDAAGTPLGSLVLSPSAGRMVVSAAGLAPPPRGSEYRCWVEVGGARAVLGTMWQADDVAWWAGDVALPATLPPGVVYGVSLVEEGAPGPGSVVLTGEL